MFLSNWIWILCSKRGLRFLNREAAVSPLVPLHVSWHVLWPPTMFATFKMILGPIMPWIACTPTWFDIQTWSMPSHRLLFISISCVGDSVIQVCRLMWYVVEIHNSWSSSFYYYYYQKRLACMLDLWICSTVHLYHVGNAKPFWHSWASRALGRIRFVWQTPYFHYGQTSTPGSWLVQFTGIKHWITLPHGLFPLWQLW